MERIPEHAAGRALHLIFFCGTVFFGEAPPPATAEYTQQAQTEPGEFFCRELDGLELPRPRVINIQPYEPLSEDFLFSNPLFEEWLSQLPSNTIVFLEEFSGFQVGTIRADMHDTDIPDRNAVPNTEGLLKKGDIVIFRTIIRVETASNIDLWVIRAPVHIGASCDEEDRLKQLMMLQRFLPLRLGDQEKIDFSPTSKPLVTFVWR